MLRASAHIHACAKLPSGEAVVLACYKEAMSFEQARKIMVENMGTQFDPNMEQVFLGCREKLEEYYRQNPA